MRLDWFRRRPRASDDAPPPDAPWRGATSPPPRPYAPSSTSFSSDTDLAVALAASAAQAAADAREAAGAGDDDAEAAALATAKRLSLAAAAGPAARADALSFKLFDSDSLDYCDGICDGMYDVHGDFGPELAPVHVGGGGSGPPVTFFPSLTDLEKLRLPPTDRRAAVVVDFAQDAALAAVDAAAAAALAAAAADGPSACVRALARVVCEAMGGPGTHAELAAAEAAAWAGALAPARVGAALPLGALVTARVGSSRHRGLLFKALADACDLPCRLLRGSFYAGKSGAGAEAGDCAVVHVALGGEEVLVDLASCPASTWAAGGAPPDEAAAGVSDCTECGGPAVAAAVAAEAVATAPSARLPGAPSSGALIDLRDSGGTRPTTPPPVQAGKVSGAATGAAAGGSDAQALGFETRAFPPAPAAAADADPPVVPSPFAAAQPRASPPALRTQPPAVATTARARAEAADIASPDPFGALSPFAAAAATTSSARPASADSLPSLADLAARTRVATPSRTAAASAFYEFDGSSVSGGGDGGSVSGSRPATAGAAVSAPDPLPPLRNEPPRSRLAGAPAAVSGAGGGGGPAASSAASAPAAAVAASPPPPSQLEDDDPYEIDPSDLMIGPRIGIGSFGEVYRAQWRRTDVAVKRLLDGEMGDAAVADFKREIAILRRIKHPNIIQFLGACTRPPDLFICTQLAPRGSLFRLLHRPPPAGAPPAPRWTHRLRARMALDVARGVHYLHSCRPPILHRDLKTQNVLVGSDWSVRLCDFGLARVRAHAGAVAPSRPTTAEYAAPETIRGDAGFSEASDAWAFGVVLWELFTGAEPWFDTPPARIIAAVGFGGETLPIDREGGALPPSIADMVEACWAKEPADRPDFGALCDSLTAFLKSDESKEAV